MDGRRLTALNFESFRLKSFVAAPLVHIRIQIILCNFLLLLLLSLYFRPTFYCVIVITFIYSVDGTFFMHQVRLKQIRIVLRISLWATKIMFSANDVGLDAMYTAMNRHEHSDTKSSICDHLHRAAFLEASHLVWHWHKMVVMGCIDDCVHFSGCTAVVCLDCHNNNDHIHMDSFGSVSIVVTLIWNHGHCLYHYMLLLHGLGYDRTAHRYDLDFHDAIFDSEQKYDRDLLNGNRYYVGRWMLFLANTSTRSYNFLVWFYDREHLRTLETKHSQNAFDNETTKTHLNQYWLTWNGLSGIHFHLFDHIPTHQKARSIQSMRTMYSNQLIFGRIQTKRKKIDLFYHL